MFRACGARPSARFIHRFTPQVREPRLNLPGGNRYQNMIVRAPNLHVVLATSLVEFGQASLNPSMVTVHHDDQSQRDVPPLAALRPHFLGKLFPPEFLGEPWSCRSGFEPQVALGPSHRDEETPDEYLLLLVFAQDDGLNSPAHPIHPRATTSDSLRPSCNRSESRARAVTTPEACRSRF